MQLNALIAAAEQDTGLSDWDGTAFHEPLSILLDSINREANLPPRGAKAMGDRLHILLCNRLKLVRDRKAFPGIATEQIRRPIFVTGLPRSGSSFLLDVLAQDPANRVAYSWEIMQPSPPPEKAGHSQDPRIKLVQQILEDQGFTSPATMAAHPFDARLPEECSFIFEHSFMTSNFNGFMHCPSYTRWLGMVANPAEAYAYHRQFLQHLQHRYRGERWVLKAPAHMHQLGALLTEYPDALIVLTHRDLMKVLPSLASLASALRAQFVDPGDVDQIETGRSVIQQIVQGVSNVMKVRDSLGRPEQFADLRYLDMRADPVAAVERLYVQWGLELTAEARARMSDFVANQGKSRHGHGRHAYSMADYDFTEAQIERLFADYIARYQPQREPG